MKDVNKNIGVDDSDKKLNISDVSSSFTKDDLQRAFSAGVQLGADYGEDGENSVYEDFNKWFDSKFDCK
jgi:hypothetical protein